MNNKLVTGILIGALSGVAVNVFRIKREQRLEKEMYGEMSEAMEKKIIEE